MHFCDFFTLDNVSVDETAESKTAVLLAVSHLLSRNNPTLEAEKLFDTFWERESLGSTTIGRGILLPHIRSEHITKTSACFIKLVHPVDFDALDKQPIDLVIGLVTPEAQTDHHLQVLSTIVRQCNQPKFRQACRQANRVEALLHAILSPIAVSQPIITREEALI